jgi:hypothetical protein
MVAVSRVSRYEPLLVAILSQINPAHNSSPYVDLKGIRSAPVLVPILSQINPARNSPPYVDPKIFTMHRYWILFQARIIESVCSLLASLRSILILYFHLRMSLPSRFRTRNIEIMDAISAYSFTLCSLYLKPETNLSRVVVIIFMDMWFSGR